MLVVASCPIRTYVNSTRRVVCLRESWVRGRVINHLRYRSKISLNNLVMRGPVSSHIDVDLFDDNEKKANASLVNIGKRKHTALPRLLRESKQPASGYPQYSEYSKYSDYLLADILLTKI